MCTAVPSAAGATWSEEDSDTHADANSDVDTDRRWNKREVVIERAFL